MELAYERNDKLSEVGKTILTDRYMVKGEVDPQQVFARASRTFASSSDHADRLYGYVSNLWFMPSTPILSNADTDRGLPISCFLNYVPDSREGLSGHYDENIWLSSMGGGIGGYWGAVRSGGTSTANGSRSTGSIPFMHVVDSQMLAFSQGVTRRGSYAVYQDISHPEVVEFINMRKPAGGDVHRKCLNLHHGINITDEFMKLIDDCHKYGHVVDDTWNLIDPHSKEVVKKVSARSLWASILETRMLRGEPYIHFIDASNQALNEYQKANGLSISQSNLCSEIVLPTGPDRTAVCCLSSLNLETYDEWKDNEQFIGDVVEFLDNVLTAFIDKACTMPGMEKAVNSALAERSLGLGTMGFHAYLQKKNIAFESALAESFNRRVYAHIKKEAYKASARLALERGEPADMVGSGRRNAHLMAIAPNASSSLICGTTSPSIEPYRANIYSQKTQSGSFLIKNRYLDKILRGRSVDDVEYNNYWRSILEHDGSCQHIDILNKWEKEVFKTALEIGQHWIVHHAAIRQPAIDQAQSVNLFFNSNVDIKELHNIHMEAWKSGLKTLYYCRSQAQSRAEKISTKIERQIIDNPEEVCLSCEG